MSALQHSTSPTGVEEDSAGRIGGGILTPPPELRIHPAAPVSLSRLPDESGAPVRLLGGSGAGLHMRPARLCASGYRCQELMHRRSRPAARPTGRPQPA